MGKDTDLSFGEYEDCYAEDAILGLEESKHTVVIMGFRAKFLEVNATAGYLQSQFFDAGGFKWQIQVEVQETNGAWVVGAFAFPQCTHPGGDIDPLTPRTHIRFRFLNRVRTTQDVFASAEAHHAWQWPLNSIDGRRTLLGWGFPKLCTRDELLKRVEEVCRDGNLHVEVSFRELRSCTQASRKELGRDCKTKTREKSGVPGWGKNQLITTVVQEIVTSADKQACDRAACQLLDSISKHVIAATPTCEEDDSTYEGQPSRAKRPRLESTSGKGTTSVPFPESSGSGTRSNLRFNARGARIVMPVAARSKDSQGSAYSRSCEEAHLVCSQLVLQHRPKHFRWRLRESQSRCAEAPDGNLPSEDEAVVDIDHVLLQKLPLLATMSKDLGQHHKEGNDKEISSGREAPFDAPASACGLACLLLLLEGTASSKQLFGAGSFGPSFAVQTLGMASFLGQKKVEQCAEAAVHAAVLFLLRGVAAAGMHAAHELVGPSSTFRDHENEWMQVLQTLPPETVKVVLKEHSTLWKDLKPHEVADQVLELPGVFIEEWLSSRTTLDLRGATLPLSQTLTLIRFLPTQSNLSVLHLSCGSSAGRPDDTLCVLDALNGAFASMPRCRLRLLGLHGAQIGTKHLKKLAGLCTALQGSLTGLAISVSSWGFEQGDKDKLVFFQALARLTRLRVLALSPWGQLVGQQNLSVLTPMQRLDRLKVLVHENTKRADVDAAVAIVPGFSFHRADSRRFKT